MGRTGTAPDGPAGVTGTPADLVERLDTASACFPLHAALSLEAGDRLTFAAWRERACATAEAGPGRPGSGPDSDTSGPSAGLPRTAEELPQALIGFLARCRLECSAPRLPAVRGRHEASRGGRERHLAAAPLAVRSVRRLALLLLPPAGSAGLHLTGRFEAEDFLMTAEREEATTVHLTSSMAARTAEAHWRDYDLTRVREVIVHTGTGAGPGGTGTNRALRVLGTAFPNARVVTGTAGGPFTATP
ncbi:hypothetical protein IHE55_14400 [Streptomyces pactum]|uniref:Uncharacterized protein n=1 Tax=Streptomyces pactum TaxID=68249 RepID=A0ABS0NL92_9ACTN|nr:hypothetical protein [Streptomyces pactum]MBH5335911.1 hypothetical protein [Streptomyces pactum]